MRRIAWVIIWIITAIGVFWSYQRGADDFRVFHAAWQSVLAGKTFSMYRIEEMPDRFLYAPGFAFLLAHLGFFSKTVALSFWNLVKVIAMWRLGRYFDRRGWLGPFAVSLLFWVRPLLIDFQYGQVNFLILVVCFFALQKVYALENSLKARIIWFWAGFAALSKIFPALLFLIPFFLFLKNIQTAKKHLTWGIAGIIVPSLIPILFHGIQVGGFELFHEWWLALQSRGFPYDSHNQSFAAVLIHYFSAQEFRIIPWGPGYHVLGNSWLTTGQIAGLGTVWTLLLLWFFLQKAWKASQGAAFEKTWILFGLMFLGSHLVWKPYFLFLIPFTTWLVAQSVGRSITSRFTFGILFALATLTSVDIAGVKIAGYLESGGIMLWTALGLIWVTREKRSL